MHIFCLPYIFFTSVVSHSLLCRSADLAFPSTGSIKGRRSSYLLAITTERSKSCDEGLNTFRDEGRVFSWVGCSGVSHELRNIPTLSPHACLSLSALQQTSKKSEKLLHWWGESSRTLASPSASPAAFGEFTLFSLQTCACSPWRACGPRKRPGPSATPPPNWEPSPSVTYARRAGCTTSRSSQRRERYDAAENVFFPWTSMSHGHGGRWFAVVTPEGKSQRDRKWRGEGAEKTTTTSAVICHCSLSQAASLDVNVWHQLFKCRTLLVRQETRVVI